MAFEKKTGIENYGWRRGCEPQMNGDDDGSRARPKSSTRL
jgi:hypothetical protein